MKKAIYKITNLINGKIYIGESKQPEERFKEHCYRKSKDNSLIDIAIQKYGKENFNLEIIGWFEDWQEKEKYYIKQYNSLIPNGYNIHEGGGEPPILKGEENPNCKITQELATKIQKQLLNLNITRKSIIKNNKVTNDIVRHINDGTSWYNESLNYPLRPKESIINNYKADMIIDLLQNSDWSHRQIAALVGWSKSAVTMINIGQNHHKDNLDYPIRK